MFKCALGTGIFAMPLAFRNGGLIFGVIGTIVIGYLATLCVHMLVSNKKYINNRLGPITVRNKIVLLQYKIYDNIV